MNIRLENFKGTLDEYKTRDLAALNTQYAVFSNLCKLVPMVNVYGDDNSKVEHIYMLLDYKGVMLKPIKMNNEKTYIFYLESDIYLRDFKHDLITPSRVGVPTVKKLDAWVDYLQAIEVLKLSVKNNRESTRETFLNKLKESGLKVNYWRADNSGYITTDKFDFEFEILDNGYITQSIRMRVKQDFDNFLSLIN